MVGLIMLASPQYYDPLTLVMVLIVVAVWVSLVYTSYHWIRHAVVSEPIEPPTDRLVVVAGVRYLPAGEAEVLTDAAVVTRKLRAPGWLAIGATVLVSIGLAGTFLGLTLGLFEALPLLEADKTEDAINALLGGAKLAFVKSLAGISLATLWTARLVSVREVEAEIRAHLLTKLEQAYPPISPEYLLSLALTEQRADARHLIGAIQALQTRIDQRAQEALTHRADATAALLGAQTETRKELQRANVAMTTAHKERATQRDMHHAATVQAIAEAARAVQGEVHAGVAANQAHADAVQDAIRDLSEALPQRIGERTGAAITPPLEDLKRVLEELGTAGAGAVTAKLGEGVGAEVDALRVAFTAIAQTMATMPAALALATQKARAEMDEASRDGAGKLGQAAGALAERTVEAGASVEALRGALASAERLVARLEEGGARLRDAFEGVAKPLVALPSAIDQAKAGMDAAGSAVAAAAAELGTAGETAAERLTAGADRAAQVLGAAATGAGAALQAAGVAAGGSVRSGAADLGAHLDQAGRVLHEGLSTELLAIRDTLRAEAESQRELAGVWRAEHHAMLAASRVAVAQLTTIEEGGRDLVTSVNGLREACAQTVEALKQATGEAGDGAGVAVEQMMAAVEAFTKSLAASQDAVRAAGDRVVTSTEQVTARAAREFAEAMQLSALALTDAMTRAESIGVRIDAQAEALAMNLGVARASAEAMEQHGAALASSGATLRGELVALGQPLNDARVSLLQVPLSVDAATSALEIERKALTGLGLSLREQAALVVEQEKALRTRTEELRRLHEVLGHQWAGHVGRMSEAHEQVKQAWQQAMHAASAGMDQNAERIGRYATQVDEALGLKANVSGLQIGLEDLVSALGPLSEVTPVLRALEVRLAALQTLPSTLTTLADQVEKLDGAITSMSSLDIDDDGDPPVGRR